ncbi:molybdenum cofactor sulfurase [Epargyreus clarus]|uniref:molybdenum cofactor sulfurase n=1 Tax=Epargyreus clarus TaxID=520877 RepID=UPI003C30DD75
MSSKSTKMTTLSQVIDPERMKVITSEFSRLGEKSYLDNAGAAIYPQCLLPKINYDLMNNVYMNPHSDKYTRDCLEQIRCLVLTHFNTDPSNYTVIFTSGATQSLKLVAESFEFTPEENDSDDCGSFVYLRDNHTSVLGLREIVKEVNADIVDISHEEFTTALNPIHLKSFKRNAEKHSVNSIVAYPAQSNFNGYKYPLHCIENIKNGCLNSCLKRHLCEVNCNWYVLLDAASYVATNKLDLSQTQPDFVCLSFYKIFGYPTGLGALLVKNTSADVLSKKKFFGGGTVDIVLTSEDFHVKRQELHERFEDGTIPFLSVLALKHCFDTLNDMIPRVINNDVMDTISHHTYYLAKDLYHQLNDLRHPNGNKAAVFYLDSNFNDIRKQGGIVTFNLLREDNSYIGYAEFQHMAELFNIFIRTGCFCNSGSCQRHLNVSNKEMKDMFKAGHKCGDELDLVNGRPTGAIRVSFGYYNTFNDVDKLVLMICQCFVRYSYTKPKRVMNTDDIDLIKPNKIIFKESLIKILNERFINIRNINLHQDITVKDSKITLTEIAIFPIKSCGAFKIQNGWKIGPKGFEYDREWMIVKDNGVCLTQKQNTQMCTIRPEIDLKRRLLILNCKGMTTIAITLDVGIGSKKKDTSMCHSKVCTDIIQGFDCGDEVADWISNALGISFLRLIRQSNTDKRSQKRKDSKDQKLLSLSNQAQFLLINKATVRWLKDKIHDPLFSDDIDSLTDRFRGNMIIEMSQELAERDWQKVIIGNHEFKVEGQCPRCQMVCIDQKTGEKTVEPLRTISEQFGGKLRFGIYLSYVGNVNGSKDSILRIYSSVNPCSNNNEDDISR